MKLKHVALALAATAMLTAQAQASETQVQTLQAVQPTVIFAETDMQAMFEGSDKPMQLAALSGQEMKETNGAYWNYVIGGVAGGFYNGIGYYSTTSNTTWGGWATAVGTGVVGGAVGAIPWWSAPIWGGGIAYFGGYAASR